MAARGSSEPSHTHPRHWQWLNFELELLWRHSDGPRFHQRAEESPLNGAGGSGDPALRLKNGSALDDASQEEFRLTYSLGFGSLL
jgi:hypothetical protein